MKVLLTGATGLIGSWVAREVIAAGHTLRALVRPTSNLTNLEGLTFERAEGDVLDRASVERALDGCDAVIHTAGIAHFQPEVAGMYAVNVGGVENVLGAALARGVKRAVLTSSAAALGGSLTPRIADEDTPSNAESLGVDYLITKFRGERAGLDLARRGLPLVVLRPVVVLGPGDIYHSSGSTFLALARRKLPVFVRGGASFCDVRAVAKAHVAALERGHAGEIYNLGGHDFEIRDLVTRVAQIAGVPPPREVPYPLALAVAAVAELGARALKRRTDLSRQLVKASRLYTWVTTEKARRELGYTLPPFDDSLRDTLRFFLDAGRLEPSTPELRSITRSGAAG